MSSLYLTNPNILTEIYRMREIMSLPKTTIKESIGASIYDNILSKINQLLRDSDFTEIKIGGRSFQRVNFDNLVYILDDFNNRISDAEETEKALLGKLINEDEGLSLEFYKEWLTSIKRNNNMSEKELLEKLKSYMKTPGTELSSALNRVIANSPQKSIVKEAIYSALSKQLDTYTNKPGKFTDTLSGVAPTKLNARQMRKLKKVINQKTPKLFIQDFFNLFIKSFDDVKKEIMELNAGYISDVATARSKSDADSKVKELTEAYSVAITRLLNQLETKKDGAAAKVLADAGLDSEITKMISNGDIPFFTIFRETWEKSGEQVDEIIVDVVRSFSGEIMSTIRQLFTKGERKQGVQSLLDPRTSVGQFMFTNQFAGLNKQYLTLIRTSAGESLSKKGKFALAYLAQSLIGYLMGWLAQSVIIFVFDIFRGLIQSGWNVFLDGMTDMFDMDDDKLIQYKADWNTVFKQGLGEWFKERVGILISYLKEKGEEDPNGFIGTAINIIERTIIGGLGTVQDSIGFTIFDKMIELSSQGKYDPSQFDGIVMEIVNAFGNMTAPAEVVAYQNTEDSFKSFVREKLSEDEFDFLSPKKVGEDEGKTWYKVSRKGNGADSYYMYDNGEFKLQQ